jgi:hypothetical protein
MFLGSSAAMRVIEAGVELAEVSVKTGEMAAAAGTVIGRRVALMAAAAQDPLAGDYVELGRMVPEKVQAFTEAGAALFDEWWALQRDVGEYMMFVGRALVSFRPPLPGEMLELAERTSVHGARLAASAVAAAGVAIAPLHRHATANARRLSRRRRRR